MKIIYIQDCPFTFHSVYDLYAASEDGRIVHIIKQIPHIGDKDKTGFIYFNVRKHGQPGFKKVYAHNFVWECHNGIILDGKRVSHINGDCEDNRLINLKLVEKDKSEYKTHPVYTMYAASKDGRIINVIRQKPNFGNKDKYGYLRCMVRKRGESVQKSYRCHRFIWETYNDEIPNGFQIDHIDDNKENNKLDNLQLLTPSQNTKKSIKNRTTFNTHQKRR